MNRSEAAAALVAAGVSENAASACVTDADIMGRGIGFTELPGGTAVGVASGRGGALVLLTGYTRSALSAMQSEAYTWLHGDGARARAMWDSRKAWAAGIGPSWREHHAAGFWQANDLLGYAAVREAAREAGDEWIAARAGARAAGAYTAAGHRGEHAPEAAPGGPPAGPAAAQEATRPAAPDAARCTVTGHFVTNIGPTLHYTLTSAAGHTLDYWRDPDGNAGAQVQAGHRWTDLAGQDPRYQAVIEAVREHEARNPGLAGYNNPRAASTARPAHGDTPTPPDHAAGSAATGAVPGDGRTGLLTSVVRAHAAWTPSPGWQQVREWSDDRIAAATGDATTGGQALFNVADAAGIRYAGPAPPGAPSPPPASPAGPLVLPHDGGETPVFPDGPPALAQGAPGRAPGRGEAAAPGLAAGPDVPDRPAAPGTAPSRAARSAAQPPRHARRR